MKILASISIILFSIITLYFLISKTYYYKNISIQKTHKTCILPGYKSQYDFFYKGSNLGVSTRTAEKRKDGYYEISYKISIHKFIFSKIINRTSEGKIYSNGEVYPTKFKVIDDNKSNPKIINIKKDQLDPLSYITQLRINLLKGEKVTYIDEETLLGERKVTLTSNLKLYKQKINGKYVQVLKVKYIDNKGSNGIIYIDPKKQYMPIKTIINMKKGTKRNTPLVKIEEILINYKPNISLYGCLYDGK